MWPKNPMFLEVRLSLECQVRKYSPAHMVVSVVRVNIQKPIQVTPTSGLELKGNTCALFKADTCGFFVTAALSNGHREVQAEWLPRMTFELQRMGSGGIHVEMLKNIFS